MVDDMAEERVDREEWQRRVERWKDSGLTAKEFAAEMGINAGTLQFWQYKLKRDARPAPRRRRKPTPEGIVASLVEVRGAAPAMADQRFEIELRSGRRLRVAAGFDPAALKALLAILETA